MKKLFSYILGASILFVIGCNEADLEHFKWGQPESGGIVDVVFDPNASLFDISDIENSAVSYDLIGRDQSNGELINSANIYVYRVSAAGVTSDTAMFHTFAGGTESMQTQVSDFIEDINLTLADVSAGDQFQFYIDTVWMDDGGYFTLANTSDAIVINRGDFAWTVFVGCPSWSVEDAVGTYSVVTDDFAGWWNTFPYDVEVVAGPGEGEVTILDFYEHPNPDNPGTPYDVVVQVDAGSSVATIARQAAFHTGNWGLPYGEGRVDGGGFWFSCAGFVTLDIQHTVDIGGWGFSKFEMQKL